MPNSNLYASMKHFLSCMGYGILLTALFTVSLSGTAQNDGNEWDRMIRLNSVSERNGIYKMPLPVDAAEAYVSEVSVGCGKSPSAVVYSSEILPEREFIIVSRETPAVKPGDKINLTVSFAGDIDGLTGFVYADLDMDGHFERSLGCSDDLGKGLSTTVKVPKNTRQGKIRLRVRYTSDADSVDADAPVRKGKCYDFVLYVVEGGK